MRSRAGNRALRNMNKWNPPRLKWVWLLAAVLLASAALFWKSLRTNNDPVVQSGIAMEIGDIAQVVLASGVVQPRLKVEVSAQVSGQVRRMHVQPGDTVTEGDLLVSLNPELARNEVAQAKANVAQQAATLGSRKIDLSLAQKEAERQRILLRGQATSAAELEKAEAELAKVQRDLIGIEATLSKQEADLANARLKRNFTKVTAPISGEVVSVQVQKGQSVNATYQTPVLLTLAKLDVMSIRTLVPEADIRSVRVGQQASFSTLGDSQRQHEGVVRLVQPVPDKINNAVYYNVLFDVPNTGPTRADWPLMTEMTGQVKILVAKAVGVPTLPLSVLGDKAADGSYSVRVLPADNAAQREPSMRRIQIGISDNLRVQVLAGLQPGERVLLPASVELGAPKAPGSSAPAAPR